MMSMRSFGGRIVRQAYKVGYRFFPRLLEPAARGPLVLLYHSVEDACDAWTNKLGHNVTPRRFEDHVRYLTANFRVVPFSRICRPDAAPDEIAITFDDGSASIRTAVLPIIEKYRCPIKVYITTCNLTDINWLNKLSYLLNVLAVEDRNTLAVAATDAPTRSGKAVGVHDFVHHFDPERTAGVIDECFRKVCRSGARRLYLMEEEVRRLAAHPLVEIGSHSRNHYPLPRLGAAQLRDEVVENHRELNGLFENTVEGFAIPFGFRTHCTPDVVQVVQEIELGPCVGLRRTAGFAAVPRSARGEAS